VLTLKEIEEPVAIDDAADVLKGMGQIALAKICCTEDKKIKETIEAEMNLMELNEAGPWILDVLGPPYIPVEEWTPHVPLHAKEDPSEVEARWTNAKIEAEAATDFEDLD
jgi:hypothetical protein